MYSVEAVVEKLVEKYSLKAYLEIDAPRREPSNISRNRIAALKANNRLRFIQTVPSDGFNKVRKKAYDIIFVNGSRDYRSVMMDIENALEILVPHGILLVSNLLPQTNEQQATPRTFQPVWTGDGWKAWVKLRMERPDLSMVCCGLENGLGIVKKGSQELLSGGNVLTYENYATNRKEWMNEVSVQSFFDRYVDRNVTLRSSADLEHLKTKKVCLMVSLYYHDLLDEFLQYLRSFDEFPNFKAYFALTEGSTSPEQMEWTKEILKKEPRVTVLEVQNRGADIGGFFEALLAMRHNEETYDFLFKVHSKKSKDTRPDGFGTKWRQDLIVPLCGREYNVLNTLYEFEKRSVGMVGSAKWLTKNLHTNRDTVTKMCAEFGVEMKPRVFVGGTMFAIRYDILTEYLTLARLRKYLSEFETGKVMDRSGGTTTHAMERMLGYIVEVAGKEVKGL